jgi:hypothetical protein
MTDLRRHIRFNWTFFTSTLGLSVTVGLLAGGYRQIMAGDFNAGLLVGQWLLGIPLGLVFDLAYKEITHKGLYYFYYNQGISKVELWIVSFVLSSSFYLVWMFVWR